MATIRFIKNNRVIEVADGSNLMTTLLSHEIAVASSCHGKGICSKCRVRVVSGQQFLKAESEIEQSLRERNRISSDHRISCQTQVFGDITLDTTYW